MFQKFKELPIENWYLSLVVFVNRAGSMAMVFLVLFLQQQYHYTLKEAGDIYALYGVGALLSGQLGGWMSDRFGAFKTMAITLVSSAILLFVFPWIHQFTYVAVITFFWALAAEGFKPANLVATRYFCNPAETKTAFLLNRFAANLGMCIGPLMGGFIAYRSINALFFINGTATFLACATFIFIFYKNLMYDKQNNIHNRLNLITVYKTAFQDKKLIYMMFAFTLTMMVFFFHTSVLPIFMRDLHLPIYEYGLLFTINTIFILLFEIPINLKTLHVRHDLMMTIGTALMGIGLGSLAFAHSFEMIVVAIVIATFGEMILFPTVTTFVSDIAPENKIGAYMGFYSSCINLALTASPLVGTYIMHVYGASSLWITAFCINLYAAVMFYFYRKWQQSTLQCAPQP